MEVGGKARRQGSPASSVLSDVESVVDDSVCGFVHNNQVLMVPIAGSVRQLYRSVIASYADVLDKFINKKRDSSTLRTQCRSFISAILKVGFHQDLVNEEAMEAIAAGVSPSQQANWDRTVCPKLRFIDVLLVRLRVKSVLAEVGVLTSDSQSRGLVTTFLHGSKVPHRVVSGVEPPAGSSHQPGEDVTVTVLDGQTVEWVPATVSVVVSIGFEPEAEARAVRRFNATWEKLYPDVPPPTIVSLVPAWSGEHIGRCLPDNVEEIVMLRSFASSIAHYRARAGTVPAGYPSVDGLAGAVVDYLFPDQSLTDPAAGLLNKAANPFEVFPRLKTVVVLKNELAGGGAAKRPLSPDLGYLTTPISTKRPKLFGDQPVDDDDDDGWDGVLSHVSNTALNLSAAGAADATPLSPAQAVVTTVPSSTAVSTTTEASFASENRVLFERISSLVVHLESVQAGFEHRTGQLRAVNKEKKSFEKRAGDNKRRLDLTKDKLVARTSELRRIRRELTELQRDIAAGHQIAVDRLMHANASDASSANGAVKPDVIEPTTVEMLRQAVAVAKAETETVRARLADRDSELDTIRELCQDLTSRDRLLTQENKRLESELAAVTAALQNRANVDAAASEPALQPNKVKLPLGPSDPNPAAESVGARLRTAESELGRVRAQAESAERLLSTKEEEIRRLVGRLGRAARATAPRSPRLRPGDAAVAAAAASNGGTTSAGVGGNTLVRSRAGSPAGPTPASVSGGLGRVGVVRGL